MRVTINGRQEELTAELTVTGLIAEKNVEFPNQVSVELNGTILQRREFETRVKDGDAIEFLYFMGGGSADFSPAGRG